MVHPGGKGEVGDGGSRIDGGGGGVWGDGDVQINPAAKKAATWFMSVILGDQVSAVMLSAVVAVSAFSGRSLLLAWQAFKARPVTPYPRRFYKGGFQQVMTRREAALILGLRERAVTEKIKEAHRRVMVANHPDAGGSHYLASKINEAKETLMRKTGGGGTSAF
ncbi:hypothetical protein ACFE04_004886 [Oxalis oulophora]